MRTHVRSTTLALASVVVTAAACGPRHHLEDYAFAGRSIAVVPISAAGPQLYTTRPSISTDNSVLAAIEAGSAIAVRLEAGRARTRLDSAAARVDVPGRMADRALDRAARYLRTTPVPSEAEADYVLEIDLLRYGIDASTSSAASLFVLGEAILLDGRTGREIWSREVSAWEALTTTTGIDGAAAADGIMSAALLSTITVDEFADILDRLASYAADVMTAELREDLRDARR